MEGDELDTFSYSSLGLLLVAMDTSQRRDGVSRGASPGLLRDLSHDVMVTGCSQVKLQRAGAPPRRPAAAAALPQGRGGLPRPAAAGHDAVTLWETFGPSAARSMQEFPCSCSANKDCRERFNLRVSKGNKIILGCKDCENISQHG